MVLGTYHFLMGFKSIFEFRFPPLYFTLWAKKIRITFSRRFLDPIKKAKWSEMVRITRIQPVPVMGSNFNQNDSCYYAVRIAHFGPWALTISYSRKWGIAASLPGAQFLPVLLCSTPSQGPGIFNSWKFSCVWILLLEWDQLQNPSRSLLRQQLPSGHFKKDSWTKSGGFVALATLVGKLLTSAGQLSSTQLSWPAS